MKRSKQLFLLLTCLIGLNSLKAEDTAVLVNNSVTENSKSFDKNIFERNKIRLQDLVHNLLPQFL